MREKNIGPVDQSVTTEDANGKEPLTTMNDVKAREREAEVEARIATVIAKGRRARRIGSVESESPALEVPFDD